MVNAAGQWIRPDLRRPLVWHFRTRPGFPVRSSKNIWNARWLQWRSWQWHNITVLQIKSGISYKNARRTKKRKLFPSWRKNRRGRFLTPEEQAFEQSKRHDWNSGKTSCKSKTRDGGNEYAWNGNSVCMMETNAKLQNNGASSRRIKPNRIQELQSDLVKVTVNGKRQNVEIKPEAVDPDDGELHTLSVNGDKRCVNASRKSQRPNNGQFTKGLNIPGF